MSKKWDVHRKDRETKCKDTKETKNMTFFELTKFSAFSS